ncbi:flagellin N-terminal helical domain-containing protein [Acetobacter oeni]|uniref:Flagellin n=1 Tax=Acetobacter oeni TaxID=304077 RepID=A0A511XL14_9PROT|nr:flagellin [Acetobacter oeni]MBB3883247.1 flagellin [Acetobacter oeni]NHO19313.1 flagellin C [Acetobacter oeni]GBR07198.1 flagellin C protein [Acetobacter oeni LMG 21952]GEN63604.1 flagellin [Acetobacter oeni]
MSLSINTNTSAMVALESLNSTTNELDSTENTISTGQKVSTASDNPAAYAIAQTMNGNISGLSAVSDGLSFAAEVVSTTTSAASSIISTLQLIQAAVTSVGQTGIDTATVGTEVEGYLDEINTYARDATMNGVNLLAGTGDAASANGVQSATLSNTLQYVTGLQGSVGTVSSVATGAEALTTALGLTSSILTAGGSTTSATDLAATLSAVFGSSVTPSATDLQSMIQSVQSAITTMTGYASKFAAASNTITGMESYSANLSDSLTSGVGALTDADMAAESAKLTSLQTKQSLAISSLSVAKSSSQNILTLFR